MCFLGKFEAEMERLLAQKSLGMERANSGAREMNRQTSSQKSMERMISHKAMQISGVLSPYKALLVGFLCGAVVTYLFSLAVGTSFKATPTLFGFDVMSISSLHQPISAGHHKDRNRKDQTLQEARSSGSKFLKTGNFKSSFIESEDDLYTGRDEVFEEKRGHMFRNQVREKERISLLHSLWEEYFLNSKKKNDSFGNKIGVDWSNVPKAPHIQNCTAYVKASKQLDMRGNNGSRPSWTIWQGHLGLELGESTVQKDEEEDLLLEHKTIPDGPYPPWVEGGDEDNLPMTRRVQRDLWLHQHPRNCHEPQLRFLLTDWERNPGFGIGAQIAGMAGMLALAVNEKRILVTNYSNRADHEGCVGSVRSHWSCYFLPETSAECKQRALELALQEDAWKQGIITRKENYTSKEIWVGKIPRQWGKPWERMQPTTEIDRILLKHHRRKDWRWWRAQAVRYLMRFKSEYTCTLLNIARHEAFGMKAAKMVLQTLPPEWPKAAIAMAESEIEHYVWSNHKPWVPRPLLSIHVRLGDKAAEMNLVSFQGYMNLAQRIRRHFPDVENIWLSTEMQEVIEQTKSYVGWNFYYTNVTRQVGNMTMPAYEASLGRETSTNYPLVNFLMAAEADFFIGALGSTWCFLVDGMRSTGGKVMAGYLSVNKDRFW